MAKTYIKELQEKIEILEDGFDIHSAELSLMESELQDVLKPSLLLSELTHTHLEMLHEVLVYIKKNKVNDRVLASKDRLLRLIDISTQLNGIGDTSASLKSLNKEMIGRLQLLRIENSELRLKIENFEKAVNF